MFHAQEERRSWYKRKRDCLQILRIARQRGLYVNVDGEPVVCRVLKVTNRRILMQGVCNRLFALQCFPALNEPMPVREYHNGRWRGITTSELDDLRKSATRSELARYPFLLADLWKIVGTYL